MQVSSSLSAEVGSSDDTLVNAIKAAADDDSTTFESLDDVTAVTVVIVTRPPTALPLPLPSPMPTAAPSQLPSPAPLPLPSPVPTTPQPSPVPTYVCPAGELWSVVAAPPLYPAVISVNVTATNRH